MKKIMYQYWSLVSTAAVIGIIVYMTVMPYRKNVTSFFHMDEEIPSRYSMPKNFIILSMPGYDGMEYYQIARNIPKLLNSTHWRALAQMPPGPYAHQRILLPILAYTLSLGYITFLPYAFLMINIVCILLSCWMILRWKPKKPLYAIALGICPAMMIGLHFSLAEPLSIALTTAALLRYEYRKSIDSTIITLLALLVLTREINILLIVAMGCFFIIKKQWKNAACMLLPMSTFLALHIWIYVIFHHIPFLWSTEKSTLPILAIAELLSGKRGWNMYTLSSITLFLFFVLPATIHSSIELHRKKKYELNSGLLLFFLGIMLMMPDHIWGSITSIGRVITPVYPLFILNAAKIDTCTTRILSIILIILGLLTAIGLASIHHPFTLT